VATSGSYDFSLTAGQLLALVGQNLGLLQPGQDVDDFEAGAAADLLVRLNVVAKELQGTADGSSGMKVHTRQRVSLFLAKGQQTYLVGPASSDARATTQYGRTTLSAAEAAAQTDLSITSNTDTTTFPGTTVTMTNGDIIGIQLDDGTIQWTTISGTPASTATVSVALTGGAAAGNYVWWFTSRAQRFPVIESAVLRDASLSDTPIDVYLDARQYDQGVVSKFADGMPTAILVEPLRTNTRVTLNNQPTDVEQQIVMTVLYPSEDYDATTNDIAYPQEWTGFLEWEVTLRACPSYGRQWTPEMERNYVNARARATGLNPENSVLYFQPG
jgi:hypothetical protein